MFKRRSRLDVIYSILKSVTKRNRAVTITRILYQSNMSHSQLKSYLDFLSRNELIRSRAIDKKLVYGITDRGEEFMREYEDLRSLLTDQKDSRPRGLHP